MSDFYMDQPGLYARIGTISQRPTIPPDMQAMFWAVDTQKLYAVNESMDWYEINPTPPALTGEYHVEIGPFITDLVTPNVLFIASSFGALITRITIRVESAYDVGVTCTVGDDSVPDRFFTTGVIDLQTPGDYSKDFVYFSYAAAGSIKIYGSASSSTGFGTSYIEYDEAPTSP